MNEICVKKITNPNPDIINTIINWMQEWWSQEYFDDRTREEIVCEIAHSFQEDRLPQTYGLFLDSEIIGMYQFSYSDLDSIPDIYSWLCNVYIDKEYRNRGYGKVLMSSVPENASKCLNFDEIYLFTKHTDFYEKFGWKYVSDIDTFRCLSRIQRLYRLDLKTKGND